MGINTKLSKYLSYILRHKPDAIGLIMDYNGWASIDELIKKTRNFKLTEELIHVVVQTNDKQRFSISDDGKKIRANQGHSINIDLDLQPVKPPVYLLHGTAEKFLGSIREKGLLKMNRHHVHLTLSVPVAKSVGGRYGRPVILRIDSKSMDKKGYSFYKTINDVWLVECVPLEYIGVLG